MYRERVRELLAYANFFFFPFIFGKSWNFQQRIREQETFTVIIPQRAKWIYVRRRKIWSSINLWAVLCFSFSVSRDFSIFAGKHGGRFLSRYARHKSDWELPDRRCNICSASCGDCLRANIRTARGINAPKRAENGILLVQHAHRQRSPDRLCKVCWYCQSVRGFR